MAFYNVNSENGNLIPVAGGTLYADTPIGTIISSGAAWNNPPAGYLFCGGQAVSRVAYAALFAIIGTTFGAGDGSTTFNVPELRGEFLRGAGTNQHAGQGNGGAPGHHQDATTISHTYANNGANNINFAGNGITQNLDSIPTATGYYQTINSANHGSSAPYNFGTVRPTNTSVNFFIKATNVAVPADFMNSVNSIYGPLIPSDASASNKLVTTAENNFKYQVLTTDSDLNDVKTSGTYSIYISDAASQATNHAPTYGWLQLIVIQMNNSQVFCNQILYSADGKMFMRECGNGAWSAWKQIVANTVQSGTYTIPAQTIANGSYAEIEIPLVPNDFYCGRIDFGNLPSVNMSLSYNDFSGSFQDTRSTESRQQYVLYPIGKANLATLHVYLTNYTGSPVAISDVSIIYYLEHHKTQ